MNTLELLKALEDLKARMISVATGTSPHLMGLMFAPHLDSRERFHNFLFYIPGVEFQLCVGKQVTDELKRLTNCRTAPNCPIYLSGLVLERAMRAARELR